MWWVVLVAGGLVVGCTAVWAGPAAGVFVALMIGVQVGLLALMRRADRRTAASIEANVRDAIARRDRLLARCRPPA